MPRASILFSYPIRCKFPILVRIKRPIIATYEYLREEDPEQAYFAARRLPVRHDLAVAADLMLEVDPECAGPEPIERNRTAKPSLRLGLERRLRIHLGGEELATLASPLATASRAKDRTMAARLAAVIPPYISLAWLDTLAGDASPGVQEAARDAVRRRALEASAMERRALLMTSPKPLQWARLLAIIELVDPFFLWSRADPSNLGGRLRRTAFRVLRRSGSGPESAAQAARGRSQEGRQGSLTTWRMLRKGSNSAAAIVQRTG
ncbi:hypothetical protein [Rhizobium sp. LjRoot254]|uniref:hypothetical protein n=1 Tax=Rhizobium sp. LjRoot254 TaxID=3342297 RepID=UPI003ECE567F